MISVVLHRWHIALLLYGTVVALLLAFKPSIMFTREGRAKNLGGRIDETTSVFAPALAIPFIGLFCYFCAALVEMVTT
jgi:hypothetical protein